MIKNDLMNILSIIFNLKILKRMDSCPLFSYSESRHSTYELRILRVLDYFVISFLKQNYEEFYLNPFAFLSTYDAILAFFIMHALNINNFLLHITGSTGMKNTSVITIRDISSELLYGTNVCIKLL
jgi:hypothetical protein